MKPAATHEPGPPEEDRPDAGGDDDLLPLAAAVLHDGRGDIDAQLAAFAEQQRQAGRRVRGVVMTYPDGGIACRGAMVLRDIETGDEYLVSQPLGPDSTACRADPQGFARASAVFRAALVENPDLVLSNRFGGLESEGGGFAAELLELMAQGVPVLTAVAERHLAAWHHFSGDAPVLPAQPEAWASWLDEALRWRDAAASGRR